MGRYSAIIKNIVNTASLKKGGRPPRLPEGNHVVALRTFRGKDSEKTPGNYFFYAQVEIVASDVPGLQAGEAHEWPWFVNKPGWKGRYEADRMRDFTITLIQCAQALGDTRAADEIADNIEDQPDLYAGLMLNVCVRKALNHKTGQVMPLSDGSGHVMEALWSPAEQNPEIFQTLNAKINAQLGQEAAERAQRQVVQPTAPSQPVQMPVAPPQLPSFPAQRPTAQASGGNPLAAMLANYKK